MKPIKNKIEWRKEVCEFKFFKFQEIFLKKFVVKHLIKNIFRQILRKIMFQSHVLQPKIKSHLVTSCEVYFYKFFIVPYLLKIAAYTQHFL